MWAPTRSCEAPCEWRAKWQATVHTWRPSTASSSPDEPTPTHTQTWTERSISIYISKLVGSRYANLCPGRIGGWLQMNRLSSRNNWLKFKISGNLPIILEESIEYTSNEWKQNRKMSTCDCLDLESLASWPTLYAQKLYRHWCESSTNTRGPAPHTQRRSNPCGKWCSRRLTVSSCWTWF